MSFPLLFLLDLGFNRSPIDLTNFLSSILQLPIVFLLSNSLQIFLPEGHHDVQVTFVVSCQLQCTVPAIPIDMHTNSSVVVFVLDVDGFSFIGLVEKKSHRGISDDLGRIVSKFTDEDHLFWHLNSSKGCLGTF